MNPSSNSSANREHFSALTPRLMLQLAAPHTWPASIAPVLIACALSFQTLDGHALSGFMACVLLVISILLQSAVNTINDYFDYVKGTDTRENQDDPTDAVLVYNNVNPTQARTYAIALIVCAFLLGLYVIWYAGIIPLIIALIGVVIIFLYSGSKTPISYLPLGEVVSGFTMGGLITLASYQALTGVFDGTVLIWSLPVMLGIALIMLTNNTCDIEKDITAHRQTLPVLLGRKNARTLYHGIIYTWIVLVCLLVIVRDGSGWIVLPFMLVAVHPIGRALIANPLIPSSRAGAFAQCTSLNIALAAFYAAGLWAYTLPVSFFPLV